MLSTHGYGANMFTLKRHISFKKLKRKNMEIMFCAHIVNISGTPINLLLVLLRSPWRHFFGICCFHVNICFCSPENVGIFPSFLKDIFTRYWILKSQGFPPSISNISLHSLYKKTLFSQVSWEKGKYQLFNVLRFSLSCYFVNSKPEN